VDGRAVPDLIEDKKNAAMAPALLELTGVSKSFGGVQALRDVDFSLLAGQIHGLAGENGAGKSTLMKIIAGAHGADEGHMKIDGEEVRFRSSRDALAAGIGMVHQELSVAPELSVAENVFLGVQPVNRFGIVDWRDMARAAAEQLRNLGLDIDPRARLGDFPIGVQQLVELSRVLFSGARIIILDEPTSALSPPEIERLFGVLKALKASGRSIVFISHFLDDILKISDVITVFRNGRKVATDAVTEGIDKSWIIERMIGAGREELEESYLGQIKLDSRPDAPVALEARGLTLAPAYKDISFAARSGEVLGIYGFMGCGQLELARTLFGRLRPDRGSLEIAGRSAVLANTTAAKKAGIAYVAESRRAMLFGEEPVFKNVSIALLERLSRWLLKPERERTIAAERARSLDIRPPNVEARLGGLSGGNQQKVALAKWLTYPPRILLLAEPTRGMDVGAKEDVLKIVRTLRDQGIAIVVFSTEPETVLSLADRVLVMRKGEFAHEFAGESISKDRLLAAA
jgi:ribose transport system ATP-binding protein